MIFDLYQKILLKKKNNIKSFAVLIDPEKIKDERSLLETISLAKTANIDYFFVGGSLVVSNTMSQIVSAVKANCEIPAIIFPGSYMQIDPSADGILFLSLISGRNPEYLIGQHVVAAPILKKSAIEVLSTGYILLGDSIKTSVSYISHTQPIPLEKANIAACTAIAGEMLGLKLIYLDAGSGAEKSIPPKTINKVRRSIDVPLIVGGGIDSGQKALQAIEAGADIVVVGNAIEKNTTLITDIAEKIHSYNILKKAKEII